MSVEAEQDSGPLDIIKLLSVALLIVVAVGGFYYFNDESTLLRVIGLLVMLGVAVVVFLTTHFGNQLSQFAQGSQVELRKVVWPTRKETIQTTLIVMVMVLFVGVLLWMFDGLLMWGIGFVTGQDG